MRNISRAGGVGLLVFGLGGAVAFFGSGAPGGTYKEDAIAGFMASGHYPAGILLPTLGALASIGLLVFAHELRHLGATAGRLVWGLAVAAVANAVTGAFLVAGIDYGMMEGGAPVQTGVPHAVVYAIAEIGNLVALCAPALLVGVAGLILATRSALPMWLRAFTFVAGICGIAAPLYFTYFVFVLWTVVLGAWAAATGASRTSAAHAVSAGATV